MNQWLVTATVACSLCTWSAWAAEEKPNLLENGGFEQMSGELPTAWIQTHHQIQPLVVSPEHYEGKVSGMAVGDGVARMWRQGVVPGPVDGDKAWELSAMVKTEGVVLGAEDYLQLYAHVMYKGRPYAEATHFYVQAEPGTQDWTRLSVLGAATSDAPIEEIVISVMGKLSQGRAYFDDVQLTANETLSTESLLLGKITDLREHLEKAGNVDETIAGAAQSLEKAEAALTQAAPDVQAATNQWQSAAMQLSHDAWAAMYPDAMADEPVEAQMMYHGIGRTKADNDAYLDKIQLAGCNGVFLSLGSWMSVVYHSDVLPVEKDWKDFDALTYFIEEAHKRGIKVYAYLACFYGSSSPTVLPGSLAEKHPEWLADGPDPNMPTFPDPANPQVVDYMLGVYRELATRYDLDGIGLDYIRYPTARSLNYDERNRKQIQERFGIDILEHPNLWGDPETLAKVQQYRWETVGNVVQQVTQAVREARPGIDIMACLISEPDMAKDYGQNWSVSAKWLDYASPMNYDDRPLDEAMMAAQREICDRTGAVWIPAVGGMPEVHRQWTISDWERRIAATRAHDADGLIIYRIGDLDPAVAAFFGKGPFHRDASFPEPPSR